MIERYRPVVGYYTATVVTERTYSNVGQSSSPDNMPMISSMISDRRRLVSCRRLSPLSSRIVNFVVFWITAAVKTPTSSKYPPDRITTKCAARDAEVVNLATARHSFGKENKKPYLIHQLFSKIGSRHIL